VMATHVKLNLYYHVTKSAFLTHTRLARCLNVPTKLASVPCFLFLDSLKRLYCTNFHQYDELVFFPVIQNVKFTFKLLDLSDGNRFVLCCWYKYDVDVGSYV
jgi:hypothetical protein